MREHGPLVDLRCITAFQTPQLGQNLITPAQENDSGSDQLIIWACVINERAITRLIILGQGGSRDRTEGSTTLVKFCILGYSYYRRAYCKYNYSITTVESSLKDWQTKIIVNSSPVYVGKCAIVVDI